MFLGSFSNSDRGTGVLKFSEMETVEGSDPESAKYLYQKGKHNIKYVCAFFLLNLFRFIT